MNNSYFSTAEINYNYGYPDVKHIWNSTSLSRRDNHDSYSLFVQDVKTLCKKNHLITTSQDTCRIPPHETIPQLTKAIMDETEQFTHNKKRSNKQNYRTDKSPFMGPMESIIKQTVALNFLTDLEKLHANSDGPNTAIYPAFSFNLNGRQAIKNSFNRKNKLIPNEDALRTVTPHLGKGSYYKIQGNLSIASTLSDFSYPAYKAMIKSYTLEGLRDIARIFQEYQVELDSNYSNRDAILGTLRMEATVTDYENDDHHLAIATRNFAILQWTDQMLSPTMDENHPRYNYDDLRTQCYYDEFLFAYYKTLDSTVTQDDFATKLRNGVIITQFIDNYQTMVGNQKFSQFEAWAQIAMDDYMDGNQSQVDNNIFPTAKPTAPRLKP